MLLGRVTGLLRAIIFYPLVAIVSALIIMASVNFAAFPPKIAPQNGAAAADDGLAFDAEALSHLDAGPDQVRHVMRDELGAITSVQIATLAGRKEATPARTGARLLLTPEAAARFAGKALIVEARVRPLPYVTAEKVAVAIEAESGPAAWIVEPFPPTAVTDAQSGDVGTSLWLRFTIPPIDGAPKAVGFWPSAQDQDSNFGFELLEVRVRPAQPGRA